MKLFYIQSHRIYEADASMPIYIYIEKSYRIVYTFYIKKINNMLISNKPMHKNIINK